jgi:poly-gamma-glutamate capsule biosynthesis protein CapA/YwtB (metallophosphatase superfamily)
MTRWLLAVCAWLASLAWAQPVLTPSAPVSALPQTPAAQTVSVVMVGDLMLDGAPGDWMRRGHDPFAKVAHWLRQADVRLGNLECVVARSGSPEPNKPNVFRAHPRSLLYLRRHFDAVGLANNHSGDYGAVAFREMLARLSQAGLGYYGGGHDLAQAHTPWVVERHGLRIAFLGYNEFQPRSFEADHDRPGVAWSEDAQVVHDIRQARSQWKADLVIPVMHWGWEEPRANARQRELARRMIDAGADAVVGGHPHQVQDIETYQGKPIFYSLGNFVFDGFTLPENRRGWLLRLELDRQGVRDWQVHTVQIDRRGLPHPTASTLRSR